MGARRSRLIEHTLNAVEQRMGFMIPESERRAIRAMLDFAGRPPKVLTTPDPARPRIEDIVQKAVEEALAERERPVLRRRRLPMPEPVS